MMSLEIETVFKATPTRFKETKMELEDLRIKLKETRTVFMETPIVFGVLSMELMAMVIMFREEEIQSAE